MDNKDQNFKKVSTKDGDYQTPKCDQELATALTHRFDKLTGTEMKKIEVHKMEGDKTINTLKREYAEMKRNVIFSKKKLDESEKLASCQTGTINQLLQANSGITEKFNELKRFHYQFLLSNITNAEKRSINCHTKNEDLSTILQAIFEKDTSMKTINSTIADKTRRLDDEMIEKIAVKEKSLQDIIMKLNQYSNESQQLAELLKRSCKLEIVETHLEEKRKKILQLEADVNLVEEENRKKVDELKRQNNEYLQDLSAKNTLIKEKEDTSSKILVELSQKENHCLVLNKELKEAENSEGDLTKQVLKKREMYENSKKSFDESSDNINEELEKIKHEIEISKENFNKSEENLRNELNDYHSKNEQQKDLPKRLENELATCAKLKSTRLSKQKEMVPLEKELQDSLKKANEMLRKQDQILTDLKNKKVKIDAKIKQLQDKRDSAKKTLDSKSNEEDITESLKDPTPSQKHRNDDLESTDSRNVKSRYSNHHSPKNRAASSVNSKSSFSMELSDSSDDSDIDEFKIVNLEPEKTSTSIDDSSNDASADGLEKNVENSRGSNSNAKPLERNNITSTYSSQKAPISSPKPNDLDVFKVPVGYGTSYKGKKITPVKKRY